MYVSSAEKVTYKIQKKIYVSLYVIIRTVIHA